MRVRFTDVHATVFLDPRQATCVDALRKRWDPIMASQIGPHVTVTYPDEIPTLAAMSEHVAGAAREIAPFRLGLGAIDCFDRPEHGIYVQVHDLDGGWRSLREVVGHVGTRLAVEPHVTLVHPRTSDQGRAAWPELAGRSLDGTTMIDEVAVTAFDGSRWVAVETFWLMGRVDPRTRCRRVERATNPIRV